MGTGKNSLVGKVYLHKKEFRVAEKGSMMFLNGNLYFRSPKTRDLPFIKIDTETLDEDLSFTLQYDRECPNAIWLEMSTPQIEFSTALH